MNVRTSFLLASLAAVTGLGACTMPREPMMQSGQQMQSSQAMSSRQQMPMNMSQMCDMHRSMMAGKSRAEQQAMVESHMKTMHGSANPQMAAEHLRTMEEICPANASGTK